MLIPLSLVSALNLKELRKLQNGETLNVFIENMFFKGAFYFSARRL